MYVTLGTVQVGVYEQLVWRRPAPTVDLASMRPVRTLPLPSLLLVTFSSLSRLARRAASPGATLHIIVRWLVEYARGCYCSSESRSNPGAPETNRMDSSGGRLAVALVCFGNAVTPGICPVVA